MHQQNQGESLRICVVDAVEERLPVTEEFAVERSGSHETRRPDLVLFVNGIPLVVIECKRPDLKDAIGQAISQQIRNQQRDQIPHLFFYAQLLLAVSKNEARYATVGTLARRVTEQDRTLYALCRPERLLELIFRFMLYDNGEKKVARYQQYFCVNKLLERTRTPSNASAA